MGLRDGLNMTGLEGAVAASERFAESAGRLGQQQKMQKREQDVNAFLQQRLAGMSPEIQQLAQQDPVSREAIFQHFIKSSFDKPQVTPGMNFDQLSQIADEGFATQFKEAPLDVTKTALQSRSDLEKAKAEQAKAAATRGEKGDKRTVDLEVKMQNRYINDKQLLKYKGALDAASEARSLLSQKTKAGDSGAQAKIARLSGETGPLTETDLTRFGGSAALDKKIQRWGNQIFNGEPLVETDRKELADLIDTLELRAQEAAEKQALSLAAQSARVLKMSPEDVLEQVFVSEYAPSQRAAREQARMQKQGDQKLVAEIQTLTTGMPPARQQIIQQKIQQYGAAAVLQNLKKLQQPQTR